MLRVYPDQSRMAAAAAAYVEECLFRSIRERGTFSLFLSGGRTPAAIYKLMTDPKVFPAWGWKHTKLFFSDERCVPSFDAGSNFAMLRQHLLDAVNPKQIFPITSQKGDWSKAASEYSKLLPDKPDLILLGMGEDGHTASIFPETAALDAKEWVTLGQAPIEPRKRITLSPVYLAQACQLAVFVTGKAKAPALARVFAEQGDVKKTPARLAQNGQWFVDRAAGQLALAELPLRFRGVDRWDGVHLEL